MTQTNTNSLETQSQSILHSEQLSKQPLDIKLLVFDMGKVFIDFDWRGIYEGFVKLTQTDYNNIKTVIDSMYRPYESGKINTIQLLQHLNDNFKSKITHADFVSIWTSTLDEDKEMTQLLQQLRQKYPLYLLSNINETSYAYVQEKFNVAQYFEELILSYKVGYIKPDPEIYQEILLRSKLDPKHCLFIDDLAENIAAAKAVGLHGIQFTGVSNLRQQLAELGITA